MAFGGKGLGGPTLYGAYHFARRVLPLDTSNVSRYNVPVEALDVKYRRMGRTAGSGSE